MIGRCQSQEALVHLVLKLWEPSNLISSHPTWQSVLLGHLPVDGFCAAKQIKFYHTLQNLSRTLRMQRSLWQPLFTQRRSPQNGWARQQSWSWYWQQALDQTTSICMLLLTRIWLSRKYKAGCLLSFEHLYHSSCKCNLVKAKCWIVNGIIQNCSKKLFRKSV